MQKLKVGQVLWWVPSRNSCQRAGSVTVTRVGRKWANLSNAQRIDLETWYADSGGFSSPGRCYISEEAYRYGCDMQQKWDELRRVFIENHRPIKGVSLADIEAALVRLTCKQTA